MPYCYGNSAGYGRYMERREQPLANPEKGRRAVVCVETGEAYLNPTRAASVYRCEPSAIRDCCDHKRPKAGGLSWEWSEPGTFVQKKS